MFNYINKTRSFAPRNGIYLPDGWDAAWKAAKGNALGQQVCAMILGDSITQGAKHPTSWYNGGYATLVKAGLASRLGQLAGEWVSVADNAVNATGIDAGSVQAAFSPTSGQSIWAMLGYSVARNCALNDTLTLTPVQAFTDFDLRVMQEPTAHCDLTVKVDGVTQTASAVDIVDDTGAMNTLASPAAITCSSATSGVDTAHRHRYASYRGWSGAPFSSATHSIVISANSAAIMSVGGVQVYPKGRTANGLVWVRHALYGQTARSLAFGPYFGSDPTFRPTYASISDWQPAPSLVICALGINDSDAQGYGQDMLQQALDEIARPAQRAGASLLFVQHYWNTTDSWRQNAAVIKNLADSYNAGFVDFSFLFGGNSAAAPFVTSATDSHPNAAGHTLIANTILSVL